MEETTNQGLGVVIALGFPFAFAGMWCLVLRLLSWMSGWTRLASQFQHTRPFEGNTYGFQSARMNGVNFNGVLVMGASKKGFYLVPILPFRLFHKPLLIPWNELQVEPFSFLFFKGYRIAFQSCPGITMKVKRWTRWPAI